MMYCLNRLEKKSILFLAQLGGIKFDKTWVPLFYLVLLKIDFIYLYKKENILHLQKYRHDLDFSSICF